MKKKHDLEAIVDLLHEWCATYGEEYASICIINGMGRAINDPALPADEQVYILKDYKKMDPRRVEPSEVQVTKNYLQP